MNKYLSKILLGLFISTLLLFSYHTTSFADIDLYNYYKENTNKEYYKYGQDYYYLDYYDYLNYDNLTSLGSPSMYYSNPNTKYLALIYDEAGLLSDKEEEYLLNDMKRITTYGNVAFLSTNYNFFNTSAQYANEAYTDIFGHKSGTLFLIDMDNRYVYLCNDGSFVDVITDGYSNTITDNVYKYASDKDYYMCASTAYDQVYRLLSGQKISQPMKYICNFLLALVIALSVNFIWMYICARIHRLREKEILSNATSFCNISNPYARMTHSEMHVSTFSGGFFGGISGGGRSGGGRSGGFRGGRSFGGGGRRSGGGHRF